ncbi:LysR family transcriptional regulator [Aliikangiella marina]|uniref:LysR family transcriptional regulator n=1 Tax=Aliikangiella marina TaxID=1712262 RepID=A0A545T0Y3_9GAMM|nr:LysR family transcriptional regulator [Aliikangiella marina]TQV70876.1 LysR family transcriptional regulator [Aliikangiella marina]
MNDPVLNEIRGMTIFVRVVDAGSFSEAARRLGASRAVVSYQIKKFETQLGVRLINRSTRRLSLTAAGKEFYDNCRRIVTEAEQAHLKLKNLQQAAVGRVALTCPVNLGLQWVVPVINEFRKQYPKIALDIQFSESITNLIDERIDLAIRAGPLPDSELQAVKLASMKRYLCASPTYIEQQGFPRTIEDLNGHQWIIYRRQSAKVVLRKGNTMYSIEMNGDISTNNAAARLQFALAGHGLALLPHYDVKSHLESGKLIELLPEYSFASLELFAVFPQGATDAKATRLLLEFFKSRPPVNFRSRN